MTTTTESASADTPSAGPAAPPVRQRPLYARLWRGVPRELGFLLPLLPIVVVGVSVTATLFFTGLGMIAIFIGVFLVIATLFVARGFGIFELVRLRASGMPEIRPPAWDRRSRRSGTFAKLMAPIIDGHYWLYLLHTMVVNFIVGTVSWSIAVSWTAGALGGLTYWFWGAFIPDSDRGWNFLEVTLDRFLPGNGVDIDGRVADSVFWLLTGILLAATLPFVTRGLTRMHWGIARGMLGAFRSEDLAVEVRGLTESRTAAAAAEGTALRRLERDIHDGPQQRLVRLQMDLAAAERQLDADPERARTLLAEAMQQSRDALEELRAVSRGFAPPLLLDRGLVAALEALADRSPVPVVFTDETPGWLDLPVELQRNAYFIAAEAITNVAKHAGASVAGLWLRIGTDGFGRPALEVIVTDDGHGGAAPRLGHGLAGLDERVRGLGGTLEVESPDGGPTYVTARLPLP